MNEPEVTIDVNGEDIELVYCSWCEQPVGYFSSSGDVICVGCGNSDKNIRDEGEDK